ncbi:MAG TPA: hypothetical protein VGP36_09275 [Mycobacteriales bacterium]|jgi:hypothetical protein|nr:hypothetical protein [Mycobacteriales bacterium]
MAFAWCALVVLTIAVGAALVLLARALFRSIDRVERVRDEVFSMAKTLEIMSVRLEHIESGLGEGDQRMGELRADLRSTMRRDMREILESPTTRPTS